MDVVPVSCCLRDTSARPGPTFEALLEVCVEDRHFTSISDFKSNVSKHLEHLAREKGFSSAVVTKLTWQRQTCKEDEDLDYYLGLALSAPFSANVVLLSAEEAAVPCNLTVKQPDGKHDVLLSLPSKYVTVSHMKQAASSTIAGKVKSGIVAVMQTKVVSPN